MSAGILTLTPAGPYCPAGGFEVDPTRAVERAVVTHAQADHCRAGHRRVLATAETLALARARLGEGARETGEEGLMLKRLDSPCVGGRPVGPWFKWKREPLTADCVLVYAQRGHGRRSSLYSDYTFAAWRDGPEGPELVPVGKAYSGYTDEELARLDRWIRANTVERFGPVRAVRSALVLEVVFDAVQRSTRHKAGIAMRFPRIRRIRWDKPAAEADRVESLTAMLAEGE